jgi:hypothetical protein
MLLILIDLVLKETYFDIKVVPIYSIGFNALTQCLATFKTQVVVHYRSFKIFKYNSFIKVALLLSLEQYG